MAKALVKKEDDNNGDNAFVAAVKIQREAMETMPKNIKDSVVKLQIQLAETRTLRKSCETKRNENKRKYEAKRAALLETEEYKDMVVNDERVKMLKGLEEEISTKLEGLHVASMPDVEGSTLIDKWDNIGKKRANSKRQ